jgi:DNA modification methylase
MAIKQTQVLTDTHALYNGDSCEVMQSLPDQSVDLSIYSPPFATKSGTCLYNYSSDPRDLSNNGYEDFFAAYGFMVEQIARLTKPGRISAVHCMDVPSSCNAGNHLTDFPGDIIRLHEAKGFKYIARHCVWKEPLGVRLRTMAKGLAHKTIVDDSSLCDVAGADYLLLFRRDGENKVAVTHPTGLHSYAGSRQMPHELLAFRGWKGKQTENRFSHWIWRNYASAFWDDVRIERVLPYKDCKEPEDERHVHPLQLDVIERVVVLRSNPGEVVLTPFLGVGSEAYGAILNGRKAIGIELKTAYFNQAIKNCEAAAKGHVAEEVPLFAQMEDDV